MASPVRSKGNFLMSINCVYHKNGEMLVVSDHEALALFASGDWFDCPRKAKESIKLEEDKKNTALEAEIEQIKSEISGIEEKKNELRKRGRPRKE